MARPKQDGLKYFSFDTDFFYADKRIKRLRSRYGSDGLVFYIYLLTEIYRNGYYIRWNEDSIDDAIDDLNLTEGLIEQIMTFLVSRSLLFKSTLANSDTIITSPGIQKRYQEAVKSLKRNVYVDAEIWLLNEEETAPYIKITQNEGFSEKNPSKSEKNESKSGKNDTNEIKGNKTKRDIPPISPLRCFEDFINAYPKAVRNRHAVEIAYNKLLLDDVHLTESDLITAVKNYAESVSILGTEERYMKNSENFLKDNFFVEYLEDNYIKPKPPNKHSNANQGMIRQDYGDLTQLEKELLSN